MGSMVLVTGVPGVGKTSLSLEFAIRGAGAGDRTLYITTIERPEKLLASVPEFDFFRQDLLAGLGLDVHAAFAPWLSSQLESGGEAFPTSAVRVDGGLRFDIVLPIEKFPLVITPYVGVRYHAFTVGALSDGRRLEGLPNLAYLGLRALRLGLDVPILVDRLSVFGRFLVVPVFGSGEINASAYFPGGSNLGLEANGGVGVWLLPFLQVRASFEWMSYALRFSPATDATYVASGATDTWLGGNLTVRLAF